MRYGGFHKSGFDANTTAPRNACSKRAETVGPKVWNIFCQNNYSQSLYCFVIVCSYLPLLGMHRTGIRQVRVHARISEISAQCRRDGKGIHDILGARGGRGNDLFAVRDDAANTDIP